MIKSLLSIFFILFVSSCQSQKIKLPAPALKKLFGEWKYVSSSGGFSGQGAGWSLKENVTITFKSNGIYQRSGKTMAAVKDTFTLQKGASITSDDAVYLIDYKNNMDQSFTINGDTLFLKDEVHDGFDYIFIRKKK